MTPAEEIESIIQESSMYEYSVVSKPYKLTSMPEIFVLKHANCYTIQINNDRHQYNTEKMYDKIETAIADRKILVKNKIIDINRNFIFGEKYKTVPIYYKDCIFKFSHFF